MRRTNYILFNILRFNQALKLNPQNDTAWSNKGFALNNLGIIKKQWMRRTNYICSIS